MWIHSDLWWSSYVMWWLIDFKFTRFINQLWQSYNQTSTRTPVSRGLPVFCLLLPTHRPNERPFRSYTWLQARYMFNDVYWNRTRIKLMKESITLDLGTRTSELHNHWVQYEEKKYRQKSNYIYGQRRKYFVPVSLIVSWPSMHLVNLVLGFI